MQSFAKKFILIVMLILAGCQKKELVTMPYDETVNAKQVIINAQEEAKIANLPLVIIFGANWCGDCQALSHALEKGMQAEKIAKEFKIVKVNVGNFDTNLDIASAYGNPIQGGIPGAAILAIDSLSSNKKLLYVTKPGELAVIGRRGGDSIYQFLKEKCK